MSDGRKIIIIALLLLTVNVSTVAVRGQSAPEKKEWSVSIPSLSVKAGERVVGFELRFKSARIVSMRDVPVGWDVHIENNPSWNASVTASALVGAAALDAGFFKHFVRIEKNESLGIPFGLSGDVVVTRDFVKEHHIRISMREVQLASAPK